MKKIKGFYFTSCNSVKKTFSKEELINGTYYINNERLTFETNRNLERNYDFNINLNDVSKIELVKLNLNYNFGLCLYMKDGREIMIGHLNNKKLAEFISKNSSLRLNGFKVKNKLAIGIAAIFSLIIGALSFFIINDLKQEKLLKEIVLKIDTMNIYEDEIDMSIKTKGDYAKIELTIKKYYQELFTNKINYSNNNAEEALNKFCNIEYLSTNKNNLKYTLNEIDKMHEKSNKYLEKILNIIDVDKTIDRLEKYNLTEYYQEFYVELIISGNEDMFINEWETLQKINAKKYNYLKEMINILHSNPDRWYIEGENLYIIDEVMLYKYNQLYNLVHDGNLEIEDFSSI